jgi:hypothetical protein
MITKFAINKYATSTREIATVRAESRFGPKGISILRLQGLSVGRQPAWFRAIVRRDFGGHFDAEWFDHCARDMESLVVEPYGLTGDSLRNLLAFADRYGLDVYVSATSQHYPTRAIAVYLTPRKGASAP